MKRSFSIAFAVLAVLSILAKDIAAVSWQIWYVTHRAYVAKELCVNRQKPEMRCNGKCHLAMQLRKVENPSAEQAEPAKPGKSGLPASLKPKTPDWIAAGGTVTISSLVRLAEKQTTNWRSAAGCPIWFGNEVWRPPVAV